MSILTLPEAAIFLKIKQSTLEKMAREHRIPAKKVGRQWRFLQAKLEAWLSDDYDNHALQAIGTEKQEAIKCQLKKEEKKGCSGSISTRQTASEYAKVVALPTGNKRKNSTIN